MFYLLSVSGWTSKTLNDKNTMSTMHDDIVRISYLKQVNTFVGLHWLSYGSVSNILNRVAREYFRAQTSADPVNHTQERPSHTLLGSWVMQIHTKVFSMDLNIFVLQTSVCWFSWHSNRQAQRSETMKIIKYISGPETLTKQIQKTIVSFWYYPGIRSAYWDAFHSAWW